MEETKEAMTLEEYTEQLKKSAAYLEGVMLSAVLADKKSADLSVHAIALACAWMCGKFVVDAGGSTDHGLKAMTRAMEFSARVHESRMAQQAHTAH